MYRSPPTPLSLSRTSVQNFDSSHRTRRKERAQNRVELVDGYEGNLCYYQLGSRESPQGMSHNESSMNFHRATPKQRPSTCWTLAREHAVRGCAPP